jgi:hypothetical protein
VGLVSSLAPKHQSFRLGKKVGNRRLELVAVFEPANIAPVMLVEPLSSRTRNTEQVGNEPTRFDRFWFRAGDDYIGGMSR